MKRRMPPMMICKVKYFDEITDKMNTETLLVSKSDFVETVQELDYIYGCCLQEILNIFFINDENHIVISEDIADELRENAEKDDF